MIELGVEMENGEPLWALKTPPTCHPLRRSLLPYPSASHHRANGSS
jgi:hypothetical protein